MTNNERRKIYLCRGYKNEKRLDFENIIYYHIGKCGGTTFTNLLSTSGKAKKPIRLHGPLYKEEGNSEDSISAFKSFLLNLDMIKESKKDFIYGHLPYGIEEFLERDFFSITSLRNPIERTLSDYSFGIERGLFSRGDSIEELINQNRLITNIMCRQFGGLDIFFSECSDQHLNRALNNLQKKINLVFDVSVFIEALRALISVFNLPSFVFQNFQVTSKKCTLSEKELQIITKYNKYDIALYESVFDDKKIVINFDEIYEKNEVNEDNDILFVSPYFKVNGKHWNLLSNKYLENFEAEINKSGLNLIK